MAPDNPVVLTRICGHAVWANSLALRRAGLDRHTPEVRGGKIHRDDRGMPTGVLVENATGLVRRKVPPASTADRVRAIERAIEECHRNGLTGIHDAGVGAGTLEIYRELHSQEKLGLRIHTEEEFCSILEQA